MADESRNNRRKISLAIRRHSIEVRWSKRNVHTVHFPGVRLVPTTCHSMQWVGDSELHFRVQVNGFSLPTQLPVTGETTAECLDTYSGDDVSLCCATCGHTIVYPQKFKRVLPLPSDNWHDMSDSVFCCSGHGKKSNLKTSDGSPGLHQNGSDGTNGHKHSPLRLAPREGDCLVGETHFLFHSSAVTEKHVNFKKISGNVTCARCSAVIGHNLENSDPQPQNGCVHSKKRGRTIKLYRVCLVLTGSTQDMRLTRKEALELEFSALLLSLSQRYNSFRFILESKETGRTTPHLMIWVLDSRCEQLVAETDSAEKEREVSSQPVLKLLYLDCLRDNHSSISTSWSKDLLVHSVDLPVAICLQLMSVLCDSTQALPKPLRSQTMDGLPFYMGFLRRKPTVTVDCKGRAD